MVISNLVTSLVPYSLSRIHKNAYQVLTDLVLIYYFETNLDLQGQFSKTEYKIETRILC